MSKEKEWSKLYAKPHKVYTQLVRKFMCNFNVDIMEEESEYYLKHMCMEYGFRLVPQLYVSTGILTKGPKRRRSPIGT